MCSGSWTQSCGKHHLFQDVRPPILSLFKRACIQVTKRGCGTTGCTGKRPTEDSHLLANRKDHGGGYALSSIMGTLTNLTGAGRNGNTPVYHASFYGPFGSAEFLPTTLTPPPLLSHVRTLFATFQADIHGCFRIFYHLDGVESLACVGTGMCSRQIDCRDPRKRVNRCGGSHLRTASYAAALLPT